MLSRAALLSLVGLLASGCVYTRSAKVPMPKQLHAAETKAKGVVVFLPGLGDGPEDFVEHGFVETVRKLGYDAITADAHFGYYRERIVKPRLHADVFAGLKERYEQVWLVGISLGGFGSALYASEHDTVTGVVMLAPYVGEEEDWGPVEAAGGLAKWSPGDLAAIEDADRREIRAMWAWLKRAATKQEGLPKLYVGIGQSDRFRRQVGLLTDVLGPEDGVIIEGGHKWTTWEKIFARLAPRIFR